MQIECKENFDIKMYTTFKIGGKVSRIYFPKTSEELIFLLKNSDDYVLLGNCSNVIVSSNGYEGDVILTTRLKDYEIKGTSVTASCGVQGAFLSQKACEAGLSGFEFMIGFPGTVGGEVYMNASAHNQSISDKLIQCCVFDKENKEIKYLTRDELNFSYRSSLLQDKRYVLISAEFNLEKQPQEKIQELMTRNLSFRKEYQPTLKHPNVGSVFKNPENDSAGRLLDNAGMKGMDELNVAVWSKHANFIVNKGSATSIDVLKLMLRMQQAVENQFTIKLIPEPEFIGNKTQEEEELCQILYQKAQK